MKCEIAIRLNNGEQISNVKKYGAKSIAKNTSKVLDESTFNIINTLPSDRVLSKESDLFDKLASYIFSNAAPTNSQGVVVLTGRYSGKTEALKKLDESGANLFKGFADYYTGKYHNSILSPDQSNSRRLIIQGDSPEKTGSRTFLRVDAETLSMARDIAAAEFDDIELELGDSHTRDIKILTDEAIEFFLISSLYRGFDLSFSSAISPTVVENAIKKYNRHLKPTGQKVHYVSTMINGAAMHAGNIDKFIANMDMRAELRKPVISTSNSSVALNVLLPEHERRTFGVYKKESNKTKVAVARKIIGVFSAIIPNLNINMLTNIQITEMYGSGFSGKKGFNIGNEIILNLDYFDNNTVFHEFGHYYVEWLRNENPGALAQLLEVTAKHHEDLIESYTAAYKTTGIEFTPEQILEEIFVDNLGMKAAATLEYGLNEVDENDVEESVENFMNNFVQILTRDMSLKAHDVGFTLDSSINNIFNIGVMHSNSLVSTPLLDDIDRESMKSFTNFFIPEITVRETFDKLVSRGFIQRIPNGDIVLMDEFRNRYNNKGEIDPSASYKMYPWDTVANINKNRELIENIEGYLYAHRNQAGAMFQISLSPDELINLVRTRSNSVKLINDTHYEVDGKMLERITKYSAENFTTDVDPEVYVLSSVYYKAIRRFKDNDKAKGEKRTTDKDLLERLAAEYAVSYLKDGKYKADFDADAAEARAIFEFKTTEGTYLHALGELFFRTLNLTEKIDYASERKGGRMHFAGNISDAITELSSSKSDAYFEKYIFSRIIGTPMASSPEYTEFKAIYSYLREKITADSAVNISHFLRLIKEKVIPVLNGFPGPLEIIPEFKAYSLELGVAGTIDLLVIDGKGIGHIFDYKTKQTGKLDFWNAKSVNMKGTMSSFDENAESRASIQTSFYRILLRELGLNIGSAHVFYVENDLYDDKNFADGNPLYENKEEAFSGKLKYKPVDIKLKPVHDVTAELLLHFEQKGIKSSVDMSDSPGNAIKDFVFKIAGGTDLDIYHDIDVAAKMIYDKSVKLQVKSDYASSKLEAYMADLFKGKTVTTGSGKTRGKAGWRVVLSGNVKITLDESIKGEDAIIAEIQKLLVERRDIRGLANDFHTVFNAMAKDGPETVRTLNTFSKEKAFRGMLDGVSPLTWELYDFASDSNFGANFSEIEMVTNTLTGESRICILNHDKDRPLKFNTGYNNIFGNYIGNGAAKNKLVHAPWKNSVYKMRFIKAGLMMIMKKQLDPSFTVSSVLANRDFDKRSEVPTIYDVSTILAVTKAMIEVARDNGEEIPPMILNALQSPKLFDAREYQKDPLTSLTEFVNLTSGGLLRPVTLFRKDSKGAKNLARLKEELDSYRRQEYDIGDVLDSLYDFRNSLQLSVYLHTEDRINSDLWTMTDKAILFLNGFNYDLLAKDTTFITNYLMATSKGSNSYMAAMNRKTYEGTSRIREDFMEYKVEHNKLIKALADEQGYNINVMGEAMFRSSMGLIYDDLYTTNNTDRNTAFQLKHPDQVKGPAKKAYLKYLRETLEKYANRSSLGKVVEIPYGWIPLTGVSKATTASNVDPYERAKQALDEMIDGDRYSSEKELETIDAVFAVDNRYSGQYPYKDKSEAERQYTPIRRALVGIEYNGQLTASAKDRPLSRIETNIENILDNFVIASLDAEHYKDVSAFGRSLFYTIKRQEKRSKHSYSDLINTVQLIQKRNVLHEQSQESNKVQKNINKIVTASAIAGTVTQALLETFTNPLVTTSNYVADKLYGVMFGGKREFSFSSYTEAIKLIWGNYGEQKNIINALDVTYGITLFDVKSVKDTFNLLEKNSMFQSKHFMCINKLMLDNWQKITMVAYMIEEGSFYAHSLDPVTGTLVYDETKDERFKILPSDSKQERLEKKMRYEATKKEMGKQRNGLTGDRDVPYADRKLKRAWTQYDATHVKELIVETYASMDESSRSMASYYTYMGLITKMRQWLFPRMPRYFQKPMSADENQSAARLQRIDDPDAEDGFRYEWKGEDTEGIWYTLCHVGRGAWNNIHHVGKKPGNSRAKIFKDIDLSTKQKKNISMFLADVSVASILAAAAFGIFKYALDDDDKKDPLKEIVYQRFIMATTDVFFLASLFEIVSGGNSSMLIPISILRRVGGSYLDVILIPGAFMTDAEYSQEDALAAINNALGQTHGFYRTVETGYDIATDVDE